VAAGGRGLFAPHHSSLNTENNARRRYRCHKALCCDCQVVTERTPWEGGYIGINSFGAGGANVHCLFRSPDNDAATRPAHVAANATRLVTVASRMQSGVEAMLDEMLQRPTDVDMQYLVQSSVDDLPALTHPYRGFALVNSANSQQTIEVYKLLELPKSCACQ